MSISHVFGVEVAIEFGVEEAIVISHLQFWILKNRSDNQHHYDGRTWTYKTVAGFSKIFPYWSEKQVRRILENLIAKGVVLVGHYPTVWTDRTKWYAFSDEGKWLSFPICPNGQMQLPKRASVLPKRANVHIELNQDNRNVPPNPLEGESPDGKKPKRRKAEPITDPAVFDFPIELNTEAFQKSWMAWVGFRMKLKRVIEPVQFFQHQLDRTLDGLTESEAIDCVERSLANQWQGLFPEKAKDKSFSIQLGHQRRSRRPTEEDYKKGF